MDAIPLCDGEVNIVGWKHMSLGGIEKAVSPEKWDGYFKFSFVRNPWDRLVSLYHYKRDLFCCVSKQTPFCEWLIPYLLKDDFDSSEEDFRTIRNWFDQNQLDFVGRFENLQEDYNYICDQIGKKRNFLPHIYKTDHRHYSCYYDDYLCDLVAKKYASDIKDYEYEFMRVDDNS